MHSDRGENMKLENAEIIANDIKRVLSPYCEKIEIAGSIRRKRPVIRDIDMVVIPSNQNDFMHQLMTFGSINLDGRDKIHVKQPHLDLEVYITTRENWATMLLIRTGSKEFVNHLRQRAKDMGMNLHPDGNGLFRLNEHIVSLEERVACETEESIFEALGLLYKKPEERER
jgi:DNA polymerase (family 10)